MYLIHGTHDVLLEFIRSSLDSKILALLKMVVPYWLQTDVIIKLNTQTDITECREAIHKLDFNNADKLSRRRLSDSTSNTSENFPMKKNHDVPNHNSQTEKIRADTLPKLGNGSKVDLKKVEEGVSLFTVKIKDNVSIEQQVLDEGENVKDSYDIKLVPDTTVTIPKAFESGMKYKPHKIDLAIQRY
ncbi:hypothetical protein ACTFIW_000812 [Dictyostelium discoideum]